MPANVETMMYVREKPWHGIGTMVEEAPTSADALHLAGLDWNVISKPVFTDDGIRIPGYVANTRDSDNTVLGIVSDKYKIVQNVEAFQFTDNLVGEDVRYETAGSLRNGKTIFLLAQLPKTSILGDEIAPYLCFTSTHDGTGAVRAIITPIRVVCANTLNLALSTAKRTWTCKHMGRIEDKLQEATETLQLANKYMTELNTAADRLANTKVTDDEIHKLVAEMFPINTEDNARKTANMEKAKQEFMVCYFMPDISQFRNTAYGLVNAVSDFVAHTSPLRSTETFKERNFEKIVNGHPLLDAVVERCGVSI